MRFPIVLLDADDTLLDFRRAEAQAIRTVLAQQGVEPNDENAALYARINKSWWERFERGECTKATLLTERFNEYFDFFGLHPDAKAVNLDYRRALSDCAFVLPGAIDLCRTLKDRGHRLYIVTNGVTQVQEKRLAASGLEPFMDGVFISEQMRAPKPEPAFFHEVITTVGELDRSQYILLGDSQSSDMRGGKKAGITTCWFNPRGAEPQGGWDFEIAALSAFLQIV